MKTEQQYLDFYIQYKELIGKSCATGLNAYREKAFEAFRESGFPVFGTEDYKHTDIGSLLSPDFGININNIDIPVNPYDAFQCDVPNISTCLSFMNNEKYYDKEGQPRLPAGVYCGSLNRFAKEYPDVFEKYYGQLAPVEKDGLVAFNTMFVQDGYVLFVPRNTVVSKTLQLVNLLSGSVDTLVNRRLLIIIEDGAQAKLLSCDHTVDENPVIAVTQVAEIFVGENAVFDFYELEESSSKTIKLSCNYVKQEAESNAMVNSIVLTNGVTRNNYSVSLSGRNCESHLYGMVIADENQRVDNYTSIDHQVPSCESNELFKYILDGNSTGVFSGRIVVEKDAQKTRAYQNNRNLCVSKGARMFLKPQLEIYADDVKCSHGFTTGQLDEKALFYMRSRGIPEAEGKMLLKYAFANDVIEGIRLDVLKDRLKLLVEKRFRGELARCRGCGVCKN